MSAKKKNRPAPAAKTQTASPVAAPSNRVAAPAPADATVERTPRQRLIANLVLVVICIYIAMLYLLAADQWFKLGIFGP